MRTPRLGRKTFGPWSREARAWSPLIGADTVAE